MPNKKALLVGEHLNTEMWERDLQEKGFKTTTASSMLEALAHLQQAPDAATTQLLVQENLSIYRPVPTPVEFPEAFKDVPALNRGAALIDYARKEGLINSDTPAYLATVLEPDEKYDVAPEGVSKVIHLGSNVSVADQMQPAHYRPDSRTMQQKH
jgi:hypothetical protein